jgi:general stress protein CsbA
MQDIVALFFILVIVYLIYSSVTKEHYVTTIVGYNNIAIPAYYIPNIFETETKELIEVFKKAFKDDDVEPKDYKEHNPYIPFPFESSIKKLIIDYLKTNVPKFKGHKLEITTDLNKLYYKNNEDDRLFIFNINLVDNTKFMTRNVRVKIRIKNILKFIKDNTDYGEQTSIERKNAEINYRTNIPSQTVINATEILSIRLDKNNYARFTLSGQDELKPNYYQIKNVLGLMDPFVTSGRDMILTDEIKKDFEKEILSKKELLKSLTENK